MFVTLPMLRRRSLYGVLIFASFSTLWTTLAFHLSAAPFHYDNLVIGLFVSSRGGSVGGQCRGTKRRQTTLAPDDDRRRRTDLAVLRGPLLWAQRRGPSGARIIMLDAGMQGLQITNQSIVYSLAPTTQPNQQRVHGVRVHRRGARTLAAGQCYAHAGWRGDCLLAEGWASRSWCSLSYGASRLRRLSCERVGERPCHARHWISTAPSVARVSSRSRTARSIARRSSSPRMIAPEYVPKSDTTSSIVLVHVQLTSISDSPSKSLSASKPTPQPEVVYARHRVAREEP